MSDRARLAEAFVAGTGFDGSVWKSLAGDASARRYFRLVLPDGRRAVLMDAPPEQGQDVRPFLQIGDLLRSIGLSAPQVHAADAEAGFVLLEDLGDKVFARLIECDGKLEETLYQSAVDLLVEVQTSLPAAGLVRMTPEFLSEQVAPVFDWYAAGVSGAVNSGVKTAFQAEFESVLNLNLHADPVMILRDYHAENLIWLPDRAGLRRVGVLDFQDALLGDPAYDLVSLLQDARREVGPDLAERMIVRFANARGLDVARFRAAYAVSGAQRNLRILGVFARLSMQAGKPHYIDMIPRVWGHVMTCLSHPALAQISTLIHRFLPPPTPETQQILRDRCATVPTP